MKDVAETIVDNKLLINKVDEMLNQKPTADYGKSYAELPTVEQMDLEESTSQMGISIKFPKKTLGFKADDLAVMDELSDDVINKMYQDMVADNPNVNLNTAEKEERGRTAKKVTKQTHKYPG